MDIESENYGMLLAPINQNHLPDKLRLIVSRKFDSSGDVYELNELLAILKTEIEARGRPGFTSAGKKIPVEVEYNPGDLTACDTND